jgi:hypothetical protein
MAEKWTLARGEVTVIKNAVLLVGTDGITHKFSSYEGSHVDEQRMQEVVNDMITHFPSAKTIAILDAAYVVGIR